MAAVEDSAVTAADVHERRNGTSPRLAPPPQNLDAEETVLGALMLAGCPIDQVAALLEPGHFYRESHGRIYRAALAVHAKGEPVDAITVVAELARAGDLAQVGVKDQPGDQRVHELATLVPAASNAPHWARIVRAAAERRRLAAVGETLRSGALDPTTDLVALTETATIELAELAAGRGGDAAPFEGLTHSDVLALEVAEERHLVRDLIPAGAVGTIAGVPETYKSWLAQRIAVGIANGEGGSVLGCEIVGNGPVGYFWQDDSIREEVERIKYLETLKATDPGLRVRWFLNEGLALPADLERLRKTIETHGFVLVMLDSLYNFLPGIDLKDEGAEQVVARLKREVCDVTGCTILAVDHMPWATDTNRQRLRAYGGVFKNAATRFGIYIDAAGDKLSIEARGNNIKGFKKRPAYWDADTLELRLVESGDHDETVDQRAEQALKLLVERGESLTTTAVRQALGGRETITDEALEALKARAEVFDHGRDLGPWSGKNGTARYWIASIHAAQHNIATTAQLFGPGSAEVPPEAPPNEPRPGLSIEAEVGRALVGAPASGGEAVSA